MNARPNHHCDLSCCEIRDEEIFVGSIKALMLAVLEDAMLCYQNVSHSRERAMAETWLFDQDADGPFAFENVCHVLGVNPGYLRRGLRRKRIEQLEGAETKRLVRRSPVTNKSRISAAPPRRVSANLPRLAPRS
jgi:hypothetical protein